MKAIVIACALAFGGVGGGAPAGLAQEPDATSPRALQKQLIAMYQARFPDARARGQIRLKIRVDASGNAADAAIERSSGNPALDSLALAGTPMMVFVPALAAGRGYRADKVSLTLEFPPKVE